MLWRYLWSCDYSFEDYTTNLWKKLIDQFLPADWLLTHSRSPFSIDFRLDPLMKLFRRWLRISFLFLLSLSVFIPMFLLSIRLQNLTSEGIAVSINLAWFLLVRILECVNLTIWWICIRKERVRWWFTYYCKNLLCFYAFKSILLNSVLEKSM